MAVQRTPEPPQSIRQRLRAIVGGQARDTQRPAQHGEPHDLSHGLQRGNPHETPHGLPHETQRGNPHEKLHGQPHETLHDNPRGQPHGEPHDPPQEGAYWERIGDTVVFVESAVPLAPSPAEEAMTLLITIQGMPLFAGGAWISCKDLEAVYYGFCKAQNRPELSWPAVARWIGRLTKKRRRAVTEYYIPRPPRRRKEKAPAE